MADISQQLQQQVADALADKRALNIVGGDSKSFYGRTPAGEALHVSNNTGITSYAATELVISARAGTTLQELENALNENNQMLPFEPPHYDHNATLGGTIACNFSGPRRTHAGAARDHVLGTRIINGKAEVLKFGGEVMKNVAGYDVSRLMAGAMGTLGVMLEVSLKVLPRPAAEITVVQNMDPSSAIVQMNKWAGQPLPVSATAFHNGQLYVRLSGAQTAVTAAYKQIGGERYNDKLDIWHQLREHTLDIFNSSKTLWRISVPQTTSPIDLDGEWVLEWNGGLRWLFSNESPQRVFEVVKQCGGHATLFKHGNRDGDIFQPQEKHLYALQKRLKSAFDPSGIFNPGRMYKDL